MIKINYVKVMYDVDFVCYFSSLERYLTRFTRNNTQIIYRIARDSYFIKETDYSSTSSLRYMKQCGNN